MTTVEVKAEIQKVLDIVPEETLESVLDYLKSIINVEQEKLVLSQNLKKILVEDKELLKKLAQ